MTESELEGASTRRVMRQAGEVLNRELDVLYSDRRAKTLTIETQNRLIELHDNQWKSEIQDYEGKIARDLARMNQDGKVLDFTIMFAMTGWIVALFAIGYGVWVG